MKNRWANIAIGAVVVVSCIGLVSLPWALMLSIAGWKITLAATVLGILTLAGIGKLVKVSQEPSVHMGVEPESDHWWDSQEKREVRLPMVH
jgi:hypothetical protein